jgi:NADP-dependent 3-hydroxy acid dehydrogenase YdfG
MRAPRRVGASPTRTTVEGIEGKVIAITGASSGIGEATALRLATGGARVVLGARDSRRLDALATRITNAGGEATYIETDVRRRDDLESLVGVARTKYGPLDVLVSNAGVMPISPLDDLRVEDWEQMIDVNLKGVLYGIAAALPVFRARGSGQFVNLASTAALLVLPSMSVYSGTKAAVRMISEGLRQEAGDNLRVTVITPGITRTNFADAMTNPDVRAQLEARRDATGMQPDQVARAIEFAIAAAADIDVSEVVVRPVAKA